MDKERQQAEYGKEEEKRSRNKKMTRKRGRARNEKLSGMKKVACTEWLACE